MQDLPVIRLPPHDGVRSLRASWPCSRTNWHEFETTFREAGVSAGGAFDNRIRAILGVTKALREVELMTKPDEVIPPDAADNDTPRNIDEFREALARRIESFVTAQQNADGGTDGGAAG